MGSGLNNFLSFLRKQESRKWIVLDSRGACARGSGYGNDIFFNPVRTKVIQVIQA